MSGTSPEFSAKIDRVKAAYDLCFGCGRRNPIGLQLDDFMPAGDDAITTEFTPREDYRGFAGVLHGGIIAAALDETLAWAAILLADSMVLTAKLELRYRAPAPADRPLRITGRLVERRGRRLVLEGDVTANGTTLAEARGLFLVTGGLPGAAVEA